VDTLMHTEDGAAFDREWQHAAEHARLPSASQLHSTMAGGMITTRGTRAPAQRQLTTADRMMLADGRAAHAAQTERMVREAQDMRRGSHIQHMNERHGQQQRHAHGSRDTDPWSQAPRSRSRW